MDAQLGRLNGACGVAGSVGCAGGLAPVFVKGVQRSQPHPQKVPSAALSVGQRRAGSHQRGEMGQSGPVPSTEGRGPSGSGDERSLLVVVGCGESCRRWVRLLRG